MCGGAKAKVQKYKAEGGKGKMMYDDDDSDFDSDDSDFDTDGGDEE